jgi:hypothetical protein
VSPAAVDLPESELTAKTLIARAVCAELHSGHFTFVLDESSLPLIERTSCSNFALQDLQVYS